MDFNKQVAKAILSIIILRASNKVIDRPGFDLFNP